jgi:hypothetical protein
MSSIDSAGINAQIPLQAKFSDTGGVISENIGKAFQLQDMYKQRQAQAQQLQFENQAEMQKLGMEHERIGLENKRLDAQQALVNQQYQGQVAGARAEWTSDQMANAYDVYARKKQEAKLSGADDQSAEQQAQQAVGPMMKSIKASALDAKGPRGEPLFDAPLLQKLSQAPDSFDMAKLGPIIAQNPKAMQRKLAIDTELLNERKASAAQKHQEVVEEQGAKRLTQGDERIAAITAKAAQVASGALDEDTLKFNAQQYLAGDKSVLTGLGYGSAGAANRAKQKQAIVKEAKAQGMTPEMVAVKLAEYAGITAGERTLGTREANLGVAVAELERFIPLAERAADAVPRTNFVPINRLIQLGENQWSPQQAAFNAANRSVINAFSQVASRGAPTVHNTEEAEKMLNTAQTPDQYKATVRQLMREAKEAEKAPGDVRRTMREGQTGKSETTAKEQSKVVDWSTLK